LKYLDTDIDPGCKVSHIGGEIYFCHGDLKYCYHKLYYGSGSICKHPMRALFPLVELSEKNDE
jgi:hypothetical protein